MVKTCFSRGKQTYRNSEYDARPEGEGIVPGLGGNESASQVAKKPLRERYYEHAVANTCCHNVVCWMIILMLSGLVLTLYPFLYPGDGSQADFVDPGAQAKLDVDGKIYSQDLYLNEAVAATAKTSFSMVFESVDGTDVFTPSRLQTMCELERIVFEESELPATCDTGSENVTCASQRSASLITGTSITSIFYAYDPTNPNTMWNTTAGSFGFSLPSSANGFPLGIEGFAPANCTLLPEANVAYVTEQIFLGLDSPTVRQLIGFFLSQDSETKGFSSAARSIVEMSVAQTNEASLNALALEVEAKMLAKLDMQPGFLRSVYRDDRVINRMDVQFFEFSLLLNEFNNLVSTDFLMVFGSITFCGVWILVYTRAPLIAAPCMFAILLSVTTAQAIYKIFFRIEFFDFIHILSLFLILGIGADDVFVVFDAWKQSELHHAEDLQRFKYTVNRATQSVFNTSFTTATAFAVTALTPLIPISTFGIFAALCIVICFVFTFTLFPTTVLLWDRRRRRKLEAKELKSGVAPVQKEKSVHELEEKRQHTKIKLSQLVNPKNRLLKKYYIPLIEKYNKYIVVIGLILGALGIVGITQASPLSKPEQWLPTDHMSQVFIDTFGSKWLTGSDEEYVPIDVYWGIKDINRNFFGWYTGNPDRYNDEYIQDDAFDLSDYAAQAAMSALCAELTSYTCQVEGCLPSETLVLPTSTPRCIIDEFHSWWNTTYSNTDYASTDKTATEKQTFFDRLETFRDANSLQNYIGFYEGKLIYFAMEFQLSLTPFVPSLVKNPVEDLLTDIFKSYNNNAPSTAKNARFANIAFVDSAVEAALVSTVIRGLAITFPIVFTVLLFATNNFVLAAFACASIAFIVVLVLGFVFAVLGWELGVAESIVSIMIVGLSVDYTVHMGHMYTFAGTDEGFETRGERFEYAVLTMGTTVMAGGFTTLGAGLFLFGAQITFFTKMAVLLTLTVIASLYYSFFFMMPLVSWWGPEGDYAKFRKTKNVVLDEEDSSVVDA